MTPLDAWKRKRKAEEAGKYGWRRRDVQPPRPDGCA